MAGKLREVNLEAGMPFVDQAIKRLTFELEQSRRQRFAAVKLIHGYGSSGKGGVLRVQVRDYLLRQHRKGVIQAFIEGERLSIFDEDTRIAMELCPELRMDRDLDRHNNGITVVIL